MIDGLLALLPQIGLPVLGLIVMLASIGLPVPGSLAVLVSGSLAAAGEFDPLSVAATCFCAAVTGDNIGYGIGRFGRGLAGGRRIPLLPRASAYLQERGGMAVFLSRWLVAPLGPAVNVVAGAAQMPWRRYLAAELAGEVVWTTLYVGLGMAFAPFAVQLSDILGNATAFLAFAVLAAWVGRTYLRRPRRQS